MAQITKYGTLVLVVLATLFIVAKFAPAQIRAAVGIQKGA